MSDNPLPIRLAQTLGLTTSSILAGYTLAYSSILIPRVLESPTPLLLKQWAHAFAAGKKSGPPIATLSSVCYFYLAYALPSHASKSKLYGYVVAGALMLGIVPYTFVFMMDTNKKLLRKVDETKTLGVKDEIVEVGLGEETAHRLVDLWGLLNLGRAGLLVLGSVVGTWTVMN